MDNNIAAFAEIQEMLNQMELSYEEYQKIVADICNYVIAVCSTPVPKSETSSGSAEEMCDRLVKDLLYSLEGMMRDMEGVKEKLKGFISDIEVFKGENLDWANKNMGSLLKSWNRDEPYYYRIESLDFSV